jgi:hypothetical protein
VFPQAAGSRTLVRIAQQLRGAELDMHFSLKRDLVTFKDFLHTLKHEGQTKMASLLERGTL